MYSTVLLFKGINCWSIPSYLYPYLHKKWSANIQNQLWDKDRCSLSHNMSSVRPQLFKGKFFVCQGEDVRNVTNKSDCLLANYKWVRHKYNFDNLGQVRSQKPFSSWKELRDFISPFPPLFSCQALMSLFVLASKDGWVDIMYDGLDAVGVDQQVNIKSYHTLTNKTPMTQINPVSQTKKCVQMLSVNHYLPKYCKQSPSLCVL